MLFRPSRTHLVEVPLDKILWVEREREEIYERRVQHMYSSISAD